MGLGYFLNPSIVHGVVSIITHKLEFSFSESCCVIEMAEVVEVGASAGPDKHTACLHGLGKISSSLYCIMAKYIHC